MRRDRFLGSAALAALAVGTVGDATSLGASDLRDDVGVIVELVVDYGCLCHHG